MNKSRHALFGLLLLASPLAVLQAQDQAGYVGPGSEPSGSTTVASVLAAKDGKDVVLRGHIVSQVDKKHYLFADDTGQVTVKIDKDLWKDQRAGAQTPVELQGEVDVDDKLVSVDVKKLKLLSAGK